jgi:hypothetical protein
MPATDIDANDAWDAFAGTKTNSAPERWCMYCQQFWNSHTGSPGWNRCPNPKCKKYYYAEAAERLVEWAKLAREQAARKATK